MASRAITDLVRSANLDAALTTKTTEWLPENVVAVKDAAEDHVDLSSAEFL